jgi:hypothetical protein
MSEVYRKEFDVRVLNYNLTRGQLTREEYQAFLDSLPDCSANAVESSVRLEQVIAARKAEANR